MRTKTLTAAHASLKFSPTSLANSQVTGGMGGPGGSLRGKQFQVHETGKLDVQDIAQLGKMLGGGNVALSFDAGRDVLKCDIGGGPSMQEMQQMMEGMMGGMNQQMQAPSGHTLSHSNTDSVRVVVLVKETLTRVTLPRKP